MGTTGGRATANKGRAHVENEPVPILPISSVAVLQIYPHHVSQHMLTVLRRMMHHSHAKNISTKKYVGSYFVILEGTLDL